MLPYDVWVGMMYVGGLHTDVSDVRVRKTYAYVRDKRSPQDDQCSTEYRRSQAESGRTLSCPAIDPLVAGERMCCHDVGFSFPVDFPSRLHIMIWLHREWRHGMLQVTGKRMDARTLLRKVEE